MRRPSKASGPWRKDIVNVDEEKKDEEEKTEAKIALQKALNTVHAIVSLKPVNDSRLAQSLGLNQEECEADALSIVNSALKSGVAEIVQDETMPNLIAMHWRYICVDIWCNGMQLVLTHVASPLENGRQVVGPVMQHATARNMMQAWPLAQQPKAIVRQLVLDVLRLPSALFDTCFAIVESCFEELPVITQDVPNPGLPGLKMMSAITDVLVQIKTPARLSAFGLPQGAPFCIGGSHGPSFWEWRHIEASHQLRGNLFQELMTGRIVGSELEGLTKKLGKGLSFSWLRRPVFDSDTMLLSVQRLGQTMQLPPCILQLGPKLGSGAVSPSTAHVLDVLGSSAAHPKGELFRSDGGSWGALQLVLPNLCWGEDAKVGESTIRSLRDLVRSCIDTGIQSKLPRDPAQQDGRSGQVEVGSTWLFDDTMELLRDVFGVHGPLAKLLGCDPSDAGMAFETDIFEAHCIEDIIEELGNEDPLPAAALESLPWVSQQSRPITTSFTDSLISALEKLRKVQEKLIDKSWYKKKPWCARSCLCHGTLDSGCILVSGLRQFWLAGFDDDAGPTEAPLIDLAQLCSSLLLEDCQLPAISKILPSVIKDLEIGEQELADWLQVEEAAVFDLVQYEMAQMPVRALRTVTQVTKFASKISANVRKKHPKEHPKEKGMQHYVDAVTVLARERPRSRCRLRRSSTATQNSRKSVKSGRSERSRHRANHRRNSEGSELSNEDSRAEYFESEATELSTESLRDEEPTLPKEGAGVQARKRRGSVTIAEEPEPSPGQLEGAENENENETTEQPELVRAAPLKEPDLGKRHQVIFVNKRSDAKEAFMEAVKFSQALIDRIPACLLGEQIGPPPAGLVSCFSKALLWAWEVQGVALALMADRLSAPEGGVFATPVSKNETNGSAKIIASGMLPLLVASVNAAWNVTPWQRPWVLIHAELIAKKLTQILEDAASVIHEEKKSRQTVISAPPLAEVVERANRAARALPEVHFEPGHRLMVMDPQYSQSENFVDQQSLAGDQLVRRAVFGSVGATVGGNLDNDEYHDTFTATQFLGVPCSILGIGIEESREVRRKAKIPDVWDPPAISRQKVRRQHDLFSDKHHQRLDGTVMVTESIISDRVTVKFVERFPDDLVEEPHEFRFRCGDYSGRAVGYIWESENRHRIMTTQALMLVVSPEDHFIADNVKLSWCYVSDDGTTALQGENGGECIIALQKMLTRITGVQTFAKGHSLPGTLYYMSYKTEVITDPLLIIGEVELEGSAEAFFPNRVLTLVAGGGGTTLEQQEAQRAGMKLKQKRCVSGVVHVKYTLTFNASRNITLYPVGARLRIFSSDCCQNEGPAVTVLELKKSGEYSIRVDGSGEVLLFDPDDWNHEVAGVFKYAAKQKLVIYLNGAWANAKVLDCLGGNYHALEVSLETTKILQMDLNEMNHAPAWLSVLEFEQVARRYTGSIKESYGFVSDPVTGQSLDILKQPFCVSRLGASEGRDAWLDLASTLEPPKQRSSGGLEADGVLIWGKQGSGKSTLARRLAMGCIYHMGGLLPILIPARTLIERIQEDSDPLDMVLWDCHGGGGVAAEIYVMLRQAVYCRRVVLIIDEADGADEKWWPMMSYLQCLVDLGHTIVIFATPEPDGPKSISQRWVHEVIDGDSLVPKAPVAIPKPEERPRSGGRSLSVPQRKSVELPKSGAVNLLELEIRPLTEDAQRDAVAARLGVDMVPWFESKFRTASDFCRCPFGLAFLLGYAGLVNSGRYGGRQEKEQYLVEWLQSAIDAVLRRCLLLKFNACSQDPALFERRLCYCAQVLEFIGMEARRLSCHELPFEHLSDLFKNESRDLRASWKEVVELTEEGQLKLLVHGEASGDEQKDAKGSRGSIRFNHAALRDYFAARCVMRCLREGRPSLLPSFETILFDSSWDAYLRFIFELVELNREPVTLDFSQMVLGHDRFEQLMNFFAKRHWRCPCFRLELAGKDNLPNVEDLEALLQAGGRALEWLTIRCCPLGISGIAVLGQALSRSQPALVRLDLFNCTVGADGMEVLAQSLKTDQTLTYLNVGSNQLGSEGAGHLAKALQQNTVLEVLQIENNGIGSGGAELLVNGVSNCARLVSLGLSNNRIGDDGAGHIAEIIRRNSVLQILDMGANSVSGIGMQLLSLGIAQNTTMQQLVMDGNEVGPLGAWHLQEALLAGAMLQSVTLEHSRLGAEGVAHLVIALRSTECKLQHAQLRGNRLGLPGAKKIAIALAQGRSLRRIGLSSNALRDEGTKVLAKALRGNTTLEELDLSENHIGVEGAKALAAALEDDDDGTCCKELRGLRLQGNSIGPQGAELLAEALCEGGCCKLERLELGCNAIEDRGAQAFVKVIEHVPTLQILELQRNRIGPAGAAALADVVISQLTLQKLLLHGNFVSELYSPFIEDLCQVRSGRTKAAGTNRLRSKSSEISAPLPLKRHMASHVGIKKGDIIASHFRSALQVEVLDKLKRFGLMQPKPLGDMLDRIFGEPLDSSETQDWITASPSVNPRKHFLTVPAKSPHAKRSPGGSGAPSERTESKKSSNVSLGGDLEPSDDISTTLPAPPTTRRNSMVSSPELSRKISMEAAHTSSKSAIDTSRRSSA